MFGLFKKKEKESSKPSAADTAGEEVKAFAADFLPDEMTILAVTGPTGFGTAQGEGDQLKTMAVALSAWLEEDSPDICREPTLLVAKADDALMGYFRQRIPRDFIIKFKARPSQDGQRLLLTNLPEPGFDPDLKAILEEQMTPVTLETEDLGAFTLNRSVGIFQTEVDWIGQPLQLVFDKDENQADCLRNARAMLTDPAGWDEKLRAFAADKLLSLANDWAQDAEEETEEVTREQFMECMEADTLEVNENGSFQFWFNDGGLFWGHAIHLSGSLTEGPTDAQMEG